MITRDQMPELIGQVVRVKGEQRWGVVRLGYWGPSPHAGQFEVEFLDQSTGEALPYEFFAWDRVERGRDSRAADYKIGKVYH